MSDQEKDLLNQEALSEEELDNLVELTDEDGNPATFEFLDVIEYQGKEYVALLPTEEEETPEVVILEIQPIEDSEDEEAYVAVESEEILAAVFDIFKERFQDVFTFED